VSRIEDEVCKKILGRAEVGKEKYGVTMETAPLTNLEWLIHAQQEAMDLAVYLQKIIEIEEDRMKIKTLKREYMGQLKGESSE
tara:strand:- start:7421 stop:7669 length:249 start_codon:yes stop_codon:yes gene_type:complete